MNPPVKISVGIPSAQSINVRVKGDKLRGQMGITAPIVAADLPLYDGPYEVTPSSELQTLSINGKQADQDITINPIPNNWGLITWNGSVLTVS